uniref:Astacin domain-containing protein n=1 Tax=Parastrongyloides trichosuri TaxID=131310 RepID=A0A0N4ZL28_PARTI
MIKLDLKTNILIVLLYLLILNVLFLYCFNFEDNAKRDEFYQAINVTKVHKSYTSQSSNKGPRAEIKYCYDSTSESELKAIIDTLINDLQIKTCLSFKKVTDKKKANIIIGYISNTFTSKNEQGKAKQIGIPEVCRKQVGCIKGLIFYALGMVPPHQRPDRDFYIDVIEDNVDTKTCKADFWLDKVIPNKDILVNGDYDFGSIGHIKQHFCGKDKKETLSAKIKQYDEMMGRDDGLSFNDLKLIKAYYCTDNECEKKNDKECQHYGYKDPNNCSKCICPNGFDGDFCEKMKTPDEQCNQNNRFASNNVANMKLNGKVNCYYNFTTFEHYVIEFNIKEIRTSSNNLICTENSGFELKHQEDIGTTGLCLCKNYKNIKILSHSNYAYLIINGKDDFYLDMDFKGVFIQKNELTKV